MTINVTMTETRCAGGAVYHTAGQTYALADAIAEQYIYNGWATYVSGRESDPQPVMAETNPVTGGIVKTIWVGTKAEYDAIAVQDANTQYNTDDGVYVGTTLVSGSGANENFQQSGTGAVVRTSQGKMREVVSLFDFGAVGNGVADDTAAVAAAINYAKSVDGAVYVPPYTFRVTSGYTQSLFGADVRIVGAARTSEGAGGSHIKLDSTDPASFFYKAGNSHFLQVENVQFSCAQFVKDREFFIFDTGLAIHRFENVNFESVEQPIVYKAPAYIQNAAFRDVQFRNSGTIHSKSLALRCTLLTLDNVNHEGSVPENTEKVVCNLSGVRCISASNFLLEGALPSSGWTILKTGLDVATSPTILVDNGGTFENYHSEWSGVNQPLKELYINAMVTRFFYPLFGNGTIELTNCSLLTLIGWNDPGLFESKFTFVDALSKVIIERSILYSYPNITSANSAKIIVKDCVTKRSANPTDAVMHFSASRNICELLWQWAGGLVRSTSRVAFSADSSWATLRSIETNATYGRVIRVNRNGQNYPITRLCSVKITPEMYGHLLVVSMLANFPAKNGGTYLHVAATWDGGTFGGSANVGGISVVGSYAWHTFALQVPAGATAIDFMVETNSGVVANDILIAAMRVTVGADATPCSLPAYPAQVTSVASAAPTTGIWAVGDRVLNSAPAVGQPKSWVCTVAGTPGTWVSEGNL